MKMSSVDPENGDIIENPDPEADADFTNATEDEFHLQNHTEDGLQLNSCTEDELQSNNHAEDEFQLNNAMSHENVNTNDPERDEICTLTSEISEEIKSKNHIESESINLIERESKNLKESESRNLIESESRNLNVESESRNNVKEESQINSDHTNSGEIKCDRSEAPESEIGHEVSVSEELGHDVPEAGGLGPAVPGADEFHGVEKFDKLGHGVLKADVPEAELCQNIDPLEIQPDKEVRECTVHEISVVPQTLKLTKSESVESYEPECDQESFSPSDVPFCDENIATQQSISDTSQQITPMSEKITPCDVCFDENQSVKTNASDESINNSTVNTDESCDENPTVKTGDSEVGGSVNTDKSCDENPTVKTGDFEVGESVDTDKSFDENPTVKTGGSTAGGSVNNRSVNTEKSFDEKKTGDAGVNSSENNITDCVHITLIQGGNSSPNKTCVHDNSSQDNEKTNMQISCGGCSNNANNSNKGLNFSDVKHNLDQSEHIMSPVCNLEDRSGQLKSNRLMSNDGGQITANRLMSPVSEDELLSELDSALNQSCDVTLINNSEISKDDVSEEAWTVIQNLQHKLGVSRQQLQRQGEQLQRSNADYSEVHKKLETVTEERDRYIKEIESSKKHNADDLYIPQIKELEFTISQQQQEIRGLRDKLSSHDSSAKRAINSLQVEMKQRIDQVTKVYKDAVSEKDNMVIKYAQAEKNNLTNLKNIERLESKLKDAAKEKDGLLGKIKDLKIEKTRLGHELDLKSSESQTLKKETEKLREQVSSSDVRIKWAQNKLRAELDAHKDAKANLEKTNQKLKEAKEETEQIRKNCQEIVKTYQESEEIKSNSLDQQLKEKQNELLFHKTENKDKEELFTATVKELEKLKVKHRETLAELHTYQDKTLCLEEEHKTNEDTLNKFKHLLQKQKSDNKVLQDKVEEMVQLQTDFKRAQKTIKSLDAEISELKINNKDLLIEIDACHKRETEKLELTEKLSAKNAELQSENSLLNDKVIALSVEVQSLKMDINSHEISLENLSKKLSDETTRSKQIITQLEEKVQDKAKKVDELSTRIDDEKDEIKTLKRKHINSIKDLTRQLQQARRKLEVLETNGEKDSTSLGSRTSSTGSLNTLTNGDGPNHSIQQVPAHTYRQASPPEQEYPVITEQVEPDKQLLIERIVKLQRMLARRNEKIEFMDDHTHQLIDDLQKKNKIIQMYALREESGMLTPESADVSKAQIARKHSIMGSVYSSHQTDGTMTLDLSLEINRKLQAVLEDTLIKNMTLKESLDTLGEEIARLSQENRKKQLQLEKQKS